MSAHLSLAQYLYRNSATYGTPTWNAIPLVKDCKIPNAMGEADFTTRGNGGFEAKEPALQAMSFEFQIVYDPTNTQFQALRDAYLNRTAVDLWGSDFPHDDEENTPQGPRAVCKLFKFDKNETLADGVMVDVLAKPCYAPTTPPTWHTIEGS